MIWDKLFKPCNKCIVKATCECQDMSIMNYGRCEIIVDYNLSKNRKKLDATIFMSAMFFIVWLPLFLWDKLYG